VAPKVPYGIYNSVVDQPGRIVGGNIFYKGQDLLNSPMKRCAVCKERHWHRFPDPTASLKSAVYIGQQLREAVKIHEDLSKQGIDDRVQISCKKWASRRIRSIE
jgi:peptide/nickel transport system ATP-binding protein